MLLFITQRFQRLLNFYIRLQAALPPPVLHNIGKIEIIKKSLHQVTIEQVEGSYFEFGIFEGNSLLASICAHKCISSQSSLKFYKKAFNRQFYGFDSFDEGFKYLDTNDKHPFFNEGAFISSYEKCVRRFKKYPEVKLVKGYFEDTVGGKVARTLFPNEKCAIVFIDCDLTNPAYIVLEFMKTIFQVGTVVILDDYFAYNGDPNKGTSGAFTKFLENNPNIKAREFFDYGYTGKSFIIYSL